MVTPATQPPQRRLRLSLLSFIFSLHLSHSSLSPSLSLLFSISVSIYLSLSLLPPPPFPSLCFLALSSLCPPSVSLLSLWRILFVLRYDMLQTKLYLALVFNREDLVRS